MTGASGGGKGESGLGMSSCHGRCNCSEAAKHSAASSTLTLPGGCSASGGGFIMARTFVPNCWKLGSSPSSSSIISRR